MGSNGLVSCSLKTCNIGGGDCVVGGLDYVATSVAHSESSVPQYRKGVADHLCANM